MIIFDMIFIINEINPDHIRYDTVALAIIFSWRFSDLVCLQWLQSCFCPAEGATVTAVLIDIIWCLWQSCFCPAEGRLVSCRVIYSDIRISFTLHAYM